MKSKPFFFSITSYLSFLFIVLIFSIITSCQKPESYSEIPFIEYKDVYTNGDTLIFGNQAKYIKITLRLVDGDGDIGWDSVVYDDEGIRHQINLFSRVFYKENGEFKEYKVYFVTDEVVTQLKEIGLPQKAIDTLNYMVRDVSKNKIWQGESKFIFIIEQYIGSEVVEQYREQLLEIAEYNKAKLFTMPFVPVSEGQNKTLKADIEVKLEYLRSALINEMPYDTVKYEFYLIDRAFNQSNTIMTPEIVFTSKTL